MYVVIGASRCSASDVLVILVFTFVADIVVNHISFYLGIRDTKW